MGAMAFGFVGPRISGGGGPIAPGGIRPGGIGPIGPTAPGGIIPGGMGPIPGDMPMEFGITPGPVLSAVCCKLFFDPKEGTILPTKTHND